MILGLVPAYGRDYKSGAAVLADWYANKDFVIADLFHPSCGRLINREQVAAGSIVNVRYASQRKVKVIKVR